MNETRFLSAAASTRTAGNKRIIEGIIPYNSPSQDLGGFTERIRPGAFADALSGKDSVALYWCHDSSKPLASTYGKSLRLVDTAAGLRFEAELRDTEAMRDVFEAVARDAPDVSFGFWVKRDTWSADRKTRDLVAVKLKEITCGLSKGDGAYPAAHAAAALRTRQAAELEAVLREYLPTARETQALRDAQEIELAEAYLGLERSNA